VVSGGDNEDAATEERISQILSEAHAAMQKKHTDEQVIVTIFISSSFRKFSRFHPPLCRRDLPDRQVAEQLAILSLEARYM